jgi:hypothetical protein
MGTWKFGTDTETNLPSFLSEDDRRNVIFVSQAEADDPDTKLKGITCSGYWKYFTYKDSAGTTRHKAELLNPASNSGYSIGVTRAVDANLTATQTYVISATDPASSVIFEGTAATVSTTATISVGGGALSYQWQVSASNKTFANVSNTGVYLGATTNTLSISSTTGLIGKKYRCIVTAANADTVTTKFGELRMKDPFVISASAPTNRTITAPAGTTFATTATISAGGGTLSYQWKVDGVDLTNVGVYTGTTTATLTISNTTGLNGKKYTCNVTATNATPKLTTAATLTVV